MGDVRQLRQQTTDTSATTAIRPPGQTPVEPLWRDVLGGQLRRVRLHRRRTITETAQRAGISAQYLSEVERGRKDPSSEIVAAIAGALDCTLAEVTDLTVRELLRMTALDRAQQVIELRSVGSTRSATTSSATTSMRGPVALAA
ncbi:helix-turn-helix domain-containing protein [Flexivirga sp. B27]